MTGVGSSTCVSRGEGRAISGRVLISTVCQAGETRGGEAVPRAAYCATVSRSAAVS